MGPTHILENINKITNAPKYHSSSKNKCWFALT